jgi:hypothetical protein
MEEERTARDRGSDVGFDPSAFVASRPREATSRRTDDLHICPSCASELVYPVDWEPASRNRWRVALRCPNCEWNQVGIHGQAAVDRFDEVLDVGTEQLLDDLTTLVQANLADQVERFVAALWADQIVPEDF